MIPSVTRVFNSQNATLYVYLQAFRKERNDGAADSAGGVFREPVGLSGRLR